MEVRTRSARIALALAALTVLLIGTSVAIGLVSDTGDPSDGIFVTALAFGFAGAGGLIALREPRNKIGWIFLASGVAAGLGSLSGAYADYWIEEGTGSEVLGKAAACYGTSGWVPFILLPTTFLLLLFPDGHPPSPRWRKVGWAAGIGMVLVFAGSLILPGPLEDYPEIDNPLGVEGGLGDLLQGLGFLGVIAGTIGSAAALVVRFRRATGDEREQLKWLAFAGVVAAVAFVVGLGIYDAVGGAVANSLIMAGVLGLPVATGIAIVRHRLYDIDVVINRTLVYAVLSAGLAAAYAAVALTLGVVLGSGSNVATAAATLTVAVSFRPLRAWVQAQVDRRFDRTRYEGLRKVERFLADLRAGRATPEETEAVMADALGDSSLRLYYWLPETGEHFDAHGQRVEEVAGDGRAVTPVRRGALELATVAHDPDLSKRPNLLDSVIAAAGLAIEIERLRVEVQRRLAEVEESRARIVTVGYEERRRLERDLHDGAQQRLVSLGLSLRDIQGQLPADSAPARELDATVGALTDAIGELRELARGVRPAGLDDGLSPALRELATRSSLPMRVDATDERFDDSVETAAYFVASEALANATKHARATAVDVMATRRNGSLVVEIRDDGIGGASAGDGSGLIGMTDRVAALGGNVTVESPIGKGTKIRAELPCAS